MAPVPLIIDTDPGIDDIVAVILALNRPDLVRLDAITLTFGNTTLDHCRNNMLRLFDILQKHIAEDPNEEHRKQLSKTLSAHPIILSEGAQGPLGGERFTASYFHGRDGVSGISTLPGNPWPVPEQTPSPLQETNQKEAHDVILDIIRRNPPGTVRIAAVGPLTNIALAWKKDPETFIKVGGISIMGCALDVCGNTTPCAEFNTFADPFAARELLQYAPQHPILKNSGKSPLLTANRIRIRLNGAKFWICANGCFTAVPQISSTSSRTGCRSGSETGQMTAHCNSNMSNRDSRRYI